MPSKPEEKETVTMKAVAKATESLEEDLRLAEERYTKLAEQYAELNQKYLKAEARRDALEWSLVLAQNVVRRVTAEKVKDSVVSGPVSSDWVKVAF